MRWPAAVAHDRTSDCARLHQWLSQQDALPEAYRRTTSGALPIVEPTADPWASYQRVCAAHAVELRRAQRPLFWIESADVASTRSVVELAKHCSATVHVAESPGARNVAAITSTSGWLGTTLAEVSQRADTIVHIGNTHLHEMPRLVDRFMKLCPIASNRRRKHIFLDHHGFDSEQLSAFNTANTEILELRVPREHWLDLFTVVLRRLRDPQATSCRPFAVCDQPLLNEFINELTCGEYTVLVWGEDEFSDELDRLVVQRLLELAQFLSLKYRCSLLPLSSDPGRITSRETLLWLTNICTTAQYVTDKHVTDQHVSGQWIKPLLGNPQSLSDWENEFDWIICIRTLPSDRPLPDIRFHLTLDAACNTTRSDLSLPESSIRLPVASLGVDGSGHAMRVDHGFFAQVPAAVVPAVWPSASAVLAELKRLLKTGDVR